MPVDGPQYPVNLILSGRPVVVIGAGSVARRKVEGLLAGGADEVTVVAPEIGDDLRSLPVRIVEEAYEPRHLDGARLVLTATDDPAVNAAVAADADAAGIWVNSADDPDNCTFTLPAVVRRGPLMVSIATGGHSPAVAAWLRGQFEADLGPEHETLVHLLSEERDRVRAEGRSTEDLDWGSVLGSDMLDLIREGRIEEARTRLRACLSSS